MAGKSEKLSGEGKGKAWGECGLPKDGALGLW